MNVIKDKILKQSWKEVLYGIFAIIFCIKLHLLNQELERMSFSNEFELLQYKEYTPVTFFLLAFLFVILGAYLVVTNGIEIFSTEEFGEIILLNGIKILVLLLLIMTIVVLINNPIFRAVLVVAIIGGAGIYGLGEP